MMDEAIAGFPLSPQQKHLWLLAQGNEASFRSRCTVFLRGDLEPETLKAVLMDVAARHEVLRTVYPCPPGLSLPLQVVGEAGWDLREEDLAGCPPGERDERLDRLRGRLAGEPVDLARGPLWRAALVPLAPREHALLIDVPALCADRRGLASLVREIARSCTALARGGASTSEPVQYIDLSEWQNELLVAEDTRPGREHWRKRGAAAPPPLSLPFQAAAGPEDAPFQPRAVGVSLDPGLWEELRALAEREQTDLQSALLAAWAVLLAHLTGREEQGIGVLADGRNFSELAEAVGLFSRCLPLSFTVAAHRPFAEVLREVAEEVREAARRQQYFSWESWQGGPQTGAGVPYPAVAFELAEVPEPIAAAGITLSLAHTESTVERFGLKLLCSVGEGGTAAEIGFDAARFREEDVRLLAEGLAAVLTGALADPAGAVGDLEILGPGERARCVVDFNRPEPPLPAAADLCALFDRQAEEHPETLAVIAGEQSLTYRELAGRANRLGHHLRRLGVGPEVCVALCLDRTVEMIVSLLGVLKAGGAYVPLDPAMPQDRLELMLADSGARVLVVHGRTSSLLPAAPAARLDLGAAEEALAAESPQAPPFLADPDNLAYVIYTSGSTGRPKGVAISRGQLASYVQAVSRRLDLPAGAGYALVSTFAADLGNTVLYPALIGGGCLHVLTQEHASDAAALADYAGRHAIDCLKIVPSHLRALLDGPRPERVLPRRCLVLGGEATGWDLLARVQDLAPGCRVLNHYGPTETTVGVLTCVAPRGWRDPDAAILPLGRPLPNSRVYVVDARLRAVPGWVPGEVLIGGEGVARGYVGHPSLTAEKFVPDPFAERPGQRLYQTGDLARHLPSGLLEFLGRRDDQVKIRGFRVEPGEIETVLRGHPVVREAAVLAREDGGAGKRLAAYVVPARGGRIEPDELRSWLRQRLPDYMVPAAFVSLEVLPLTPNGKLDRRALPAPELSPDSPAEGGAPPSPAEEILIGIWSGLLGTARRIGLRDSFFELGGHSLLATQLIARIRDAFDVELPLHALFATPTVAGLAESIAAAGRVGRAVAPPIERVPREGDLPLSFAQQRLWFLDRFEPESPFYNINRALRLRGRLNVRPLGRALREIVRRHEALRTTFPSSGGFPAQVIDATGDASLPMIDLGGLGTADREAATAELATLWARRPFDLATGPLLRAGLLRLGEAEHVLLLSLHHIVTDGWSMRLLLRELTLLYEAYAAGASSPLPDLPIQYADFAAWQRAWLEGETLDGELAWWRDRLAGAPALLTLPADRPRPRVQGFRGGTVTRWMPAGLGAGLRRLALREGTTFFMVALTAYEVLLHRLSGQSDVCVGTPIAGRSLSETEGIIGLFANTLVLRGRLGDEPGFREALQRSRSEVLGAHAHQDVPFEKLVEELQPRRDPGHTPLFQAMLAVHEDHRELRHLADLELVQLPAGTGTAKCDLILGVADTGEGLRVTAEHNLDLFDAPTVARMLEQLAALLAGIAAAPEASVGQLPLLDPVQRHQVLVEANDSRAVLPYDGSIPDLFEVQAARAADAIALEWEGGEMTYGELSRRANRLAHHLATLGVGVETRVGVCLDRSPDLVVSLLAILKAGGVYVPLDRSYPRERLLSMMRDARVPLALTLERFAADLPETGVRRVCLDREEAAIAQRSSAVPRHAAGPETLAYISFTSGSTGRPKGVEVPHRGVLRLLFGAGYAHLGPAEILLHLSPVSFDASTFEIWAALLHGGRCVLLPPGVPSPREVGATVCARRVTTLWLTASLYNAVIDEAPASLAGVRQLLVGGEALSVEHVRRGLALLPDTRIINGYGPTESTTFTCCHPVARDLDAAAVSIPIGRPIANTQVHVLDRGLEPVPAGVSGELWIGGAGLARGYAGRPELTASAFLPDPFPAEPGARLYRTGDLVRRRLDGVVEYLGRLDHQVKIRGFRIELEEIETALHRHPDIRGAVVVVRQDAPGEKRLVAYVVLAEEEGTGVSALLDVLRGVLPAYMIPAAFVLLPALPLTPTGKVDRAALPDPGGTRPELASGYVPPSDPVEELLAGIWAEVLRLDRVGVEDDFFALGGHSLLATQVVSRVRAALGTELPLRRLFEAPTVAALARVVRAERRSPPAPPIVPVPRDGEDLPLSFAQQRLWLIDQLEPGSPAYNIPLAVRLTGDLPEGLLERVFAEVVRRHEVLRTTFAVRSGRPVQVISDLSRLEPSVLDLSDALDEEREEWARQLAAEEARQPFDLAHGPLLRLGLLRLGEREHLLLLTLHHIVADGWSMGVLLREIAALYAAFVQGVPSPLPELPVQYADFAVWQRSWLQGEVLEEQIAHWTRRLAGAPQVLELSTDRPRPAVQSFRGASRPAGLPPALSQAVRELGRREGATPFMTLLAAWAVLLGRHAGQEDLLVGTPIAGRNRREIEDLIGFFVNTLVLRIELAGSFADSLKRVRAEALDAYAHQDLPFERLVEELAPERDLSRSPLFQVLFVLQNAPLGELVLPGLTFSPLGAGSHVAKFDLTLSLTEREGVFTGALEHSTDLFDGSTAVRLLARFEALLEGAVADPGRRTADLPFLLPAERHQTLVEANAVREDGPPPASLLGRFLEWVAMRPDAPAVICAGTGEALSYRELDLRSATWAGSLRELGVGPEVRVGICVRRSPRMIVGLLAVLRAGGAYVPLDPDWPAERLTWMLDDAGVELVLTDQEDPQPRPLSHERERGEQQPDQAAYVIYTSGSTGRPKGVVAVHGGLAAFAEALAGVMELTPDDRVLQSASLSFDASAVAIWPALLRGAAVVLHPDPAALSARELLALCAARGLTVLELPAALWRQVVQEMDGAGLRFDPSVRLFMTGGESLSPEVLRQWGRTVAPEARLVSSYGPTEATVVATVFQADGLEAAGPALAGAPLGGPLPGTGVYLLDARLSPVPLDVPGEIFLGGAGVTRGYLGRPGLTAAVFVPDPWGPPGARLYRTGDRARRRPDGRLEFLGRVDQQVKIRGFRIEPGEIEAALDSHPAVRESLVLARDEPGGHRLVAWVTLDATDRTDPSDSKSALDAWLRERLPGHMVPSAFVLLESWPLTPTGKVDRKALPAPDRRADAACYVAPGDPVEEQLAGIWAEILRLERVGIRDDFFAIGGHSLLATQVMSRLRQDLGVDLPLRTLFERPTIGAFAEVVREALPSRGAEPALLVGG